jgi:KUP system potassium uptake protein
LVGSPIKWFGLAPYNPQIEVQPLFVTTRRPPRLRRETVKATDAHRASGPSAGAGAAAGTGGKSGKIEIKIADSAANPGASAGLAKLAAEKPAAAAPKNRRNETDGKA